MNLHLQGCSIGIHGFLSAFFSSVIIHPLYPKQSPFQFFWMVTKTQNFVKEIAFFSFFFYNVLLGQPEEFFMMTRIGSVCVACFCTFASFGYTSQNFIYESSTEGKDSQSVDWSLKEESDKIEIKGKNRGNVVEFEYSPSFSLLHYIETNSSTLLFDIVQKGSELFVKNNGKTKNLRLGKLPWIQEFKFGFRPFLEKSEKELSFNIVYSKDNSLHEMVATKEAIETLHVKGKTYETQKLKITLKGFKKRFWKAEAWYDLKTLMLVKYKSNEGPGTPFVEVSLLDLQTAT